MTFGAYGLFLRREEAREGRRLGRFLVGGVSFLL